MSSAQQSDAHTQQQSSVQYSVARVCQDECLRMQTSISKEATAALGDLVWRYLTDTVIPDIKSFRDHAKRSTITADDVKLLARRDPTVHAQLQAIDDSLAASKKAKKRARSEA